MGPKLYKIHTLTQLKIEPCIKTHFKRILSIPVMLIGLLLLDEPGIHLMYPSLSPRGHE